MHLDCAPPAPSHTRAHHAVYSIGKIVCRGREPCAYSNSAELVRPVRVTTTPGQPGRELPLRSSHKTQSRAKSPEAEAPPPRGEPMIATARRADDGVRAASR
jgi:hypothetical protein